MVVSNSMIAVAALALLVVLAVMFVTALRGRMPYAFRVSDYAGKPLLTRWELAALGEMRRELPSSLHICPQVRLADLVTIRQQDNRRRWAALGRVASKSVDFVVIDSAGRPLLVIELDDRTHDLPKRRERDRMVDDILRHCGIPVRRVRPGQAVAAAAALAGTGGGLRAGEQPWPGVFFMSSAG